MKVYHGTYEDLTHIELRPNRGFNKTGFFVTDSFRYAETYGVKVLSFDWTGNEVEAWDVFPSDMNAEWTIIHLKSLDGLSNPEWVQ